MDKQTAFESTVLSFILIGYHGEQYIKERVILPGEQVWSLCNKFGFVGGTLRARDDVFEILHCNKMAGKRVIFYDVSRSFRLCDSQK